MTTLIAGMTTRIRVGTAGVLLTYSSPIKVANAFLLLATLFAHRIDLGLARGRIADKRIANGLWPRAATSVGSYEKRVATLLRLFQEDRDLCTPRGGTIGEPPGVWLLGSGHETAKIAARHGTAYSHGLFFSRPQAPDVISGYRRTCRAAHPLCNVAIAIGRADTKRDQRRIEAIVQRKPWFRVECIGTTREVAKRVRAVSKEQGVNEVIVMDLDDEPARRQETAQRLAKNLGLLG
jgi:alkanesulfonate monooxygenase SsuD/methylene tetrahydromethanopterin reductase-like flavin-dependent oxidoreductase (luciferase family)